MSDIATRYINIQDDNGNNAKQLVDQGSDQESDSDQRRISGQGPYIPQLDDRGTPRFNKSNKAAGSSNKQPKMILRKKKSHEGHRESFTKEKSSNSATVRHQLNPNGGQGKQTTNRH